MLQKSEDNKPGRDANNPSNPEHTEDIKKEVRKADRREFLRFGALAAGLTIAGAGLQKAFSGESDSGEKTKVLTADGKIAEVSKSAIEKGTVEEKHQDARQGVPGKKFVMVIDLARCKNARKCIAGCQKVHNMVPPMEYMKVKEMSNGGLTSPYWMPQNCYHCDNPPCTKVCPVDATFKRTDGVVAIDNERCIGCKFCMAACPYSARSFHFGNPKQVQFSEEHPEQKGKCHTNAPMIEGTVYKCHFCPEAAGEGLLPSCVTSCPMGTIFYGDEYEDVVSNGTDVVRLSSLLRDNAAYRQFETLGTQPRVYYLPPVNRLFPFKEDPELHNQLDEEGNAVSVEKNGEQKPE